MNQKIDKIITEFSAKNDVKCVGIFNYHTQEKIYTLNENTNINGISSSINPFQIAETAYSLSTIKKVDVVKIEKTEELVFIKILNDDMFIISTVDPSFKNIGKIKAFLTTIRVELGETMNYSLAS